MNDAFPGDTIALSRGRFDELVALKAGVTVWGACVAETILSNPGNQAFIVACNDVTFPNHPMRYARPGIRLEGRTA